MRLLLDTHAFLWFITADSRLSSVAELAIRQSGDTPLLSVASVWEMAIKIQLQRLPIPEPLDVFIPKQLRINRIGLLPIELPHTFEIATPPASPSRSVRSHPDRAGDSRGHTHRQRRRRVRRLPGSTAVVTV